MCDYPPNLGLYIVEDFFCSHIINAHTKNDAIKLAFDSNQIKATPFDDYKTTVVVTELYSSNKPMILYKLGRS